MAETLGSSAQLAGDASITGICADSRKLRPGDMFIAIRGFATDGHKYITHAIAQGARAIVLEDHAYLPQEAPGVAILTVPNSRYAAGVLAAEYYGNPSHECTLVGITGTNGKTTVALMLESIFRNWGKETGIIGTLGRSVGGVWRGADRTTPDAIELQSLLREMVDVGVTHVAMEVSSHALDLDRVVRCRFAGAVFTNLSQDHLDYHVNLEEYLNAKTRLFTDCAENGAPDEPMVAAVNMDDPAGPHVARTANARVVGYGTNGGSQVRARSIEVTAQGARFELEIDHRTLPVHLQLTGHFNVHNALAAAACAHGLGVGVREIIEGLEAVEAVPGRFERVGGDSRYSIIVDYAHTPAALVNVLCAARELSPTRLICVMGCGGDRDRGKRPRMGKAAAAGADLTIVTSDNPRSEDPLDIIEDIKGGLGGANYIIEPDRRKAIFQAVGMCEPGDMVILAGKGHETYQEFADHRIDFDDRVVAAEAMDAKQHQ